MARRRSPRAERANPFDPLDGEVSLVLDLHGEAVAGARVAVTRFMQNAARHNPRQLVHVITGKGRGSAGRPVLGPLVRSLLGGELSHLAAAWGADDDRAGFLVRLP